MEQYTTLAEYYDRLTGDVGYARWADYVERHFRRLKRPVRSVAELACGTGSLTSILASRGYQMTAVDISVDMLSVAAQKCQDQGVLFLCQDMAQFTLLEPVDAVICCLDSVNYVTHPQRLRRTFARVYRHLSPGGLFLFDAKTPLAFEDADGQTYLDEDESLMCVWRADYERRRRICGYGIDLFTLRPDGAWNRESEYHEEYAYTPQALADYLAQAGFSNVKQYDNLKMHAPTEDARRIFFAARKE